MLELVNKTMILWGNEDDNDGSGAKWATLSRMLKWIHKIYNKGGIGAVEKSSCGVWSRYG